MPYIEMNDEQGKLLVGIEMVKNNVGKLNDQQKNNLLIDLIKHYEEPIKDPREFDYESMIESKSFFELMYSLTK